MQSHQVAKHVSIQQDPKSILLLSILFGGYGMTLLTILLGPYLYCPMFPEGVGSSCGSEVHVKEFDVQPVDAEGLIEFPVVFWDTSISAAKRRA